MTTNAERREAMRQDVLAMAKRAERILQRRPKRIRRLMIERYQRECRAFAKELGR